MGTAVAGVLVVAAAAGAGVLHALLLPFLFIFPFYF